MSFVMEFRIGFGFDIEANQVNIYAVPDEEDNAKLVQFDGLIICIPLLKIHIGTFYEVE